MAYSLVQSNHDKEVNSLAFSSNVTAGNLLIFGTCYDGGGTMTAVTGGGTWAVVGAEQLDGTNNQRASLWYCANATGGATTVTPTLTGAYLARTLCIAEFSGVATTSPLDTQDATHSFTATTTTGTDAEASNSITPAGAGELIVAHFADTGGIQASISAGTGFTAGPVELGSGGLTGASGLCWKSGGSGSQNGTFTVGTAGHRYTVEIAAFLAQVGVGPVAANVVDSAVARASSW